MKTNGKLTLPPWMDRVEPAMREAMKKVVQEHRNARLPLAFLRDGKVVLVPADEVKLDESTNGPATNGTIHGQ